PNGFLTVTVTATEPSRRRCRRLISWRDLTRVLSVRAATIRTMEQQPHPRTVEEAFWGPPRRRVRFRLSSSLLVNLMAAIVALAIAATVIGVVSLWPRGHVERGRSIGIVKTNGALVENVRRGSCGVPGSTSCLHITAKLLDGKAKGSRTSFTIFGQVGVLAPKTGDHIRVYR